MPGSPQLPVNPDPGDLASSSALLISAPTHIYLHMDIPAYTELKQINLKKIKPTMKCKEMQYLIIL